jgi:hypothetical protein
MTVRRKKSTVDDNSNYQLTQQRNGTMIKVSNTNGNRRQLDAVRVYRDGVKIGEVYPPKRNPLQYIRDHNGQYRKDLLAQLMANGMSEQEAKTALGI